MRFTETMMKIQLIGDPILPSHTCMVLLFMAYQGKMPGIKFTLLACLLFAVHPVLVFVGLVLLFILRAPGARVVLKSAKSSPQLDMLVYGGGIKGLFTGALLARAGCRVTVLVPQPKSDGGAISRPVGAPCDFVLDRCEFGQVSRYSALLSPCIHATKPLAFEPVGNVRTGWAHGVVVADDLCHPLLLRRGIRAWIDDLSRAFGANRGILMVTIGQAAIVFRELFSFLSAKLPETASNFTEFSWRNIDCAGGAYAAAAGMTVSEAANRIVRATHATKTAPVPEPLPLICAISALFREENLLPDHMSFAAWSTSVMHGIHGYHVPKGGTPYLCASLEATIQEYGGRIRTNTVVGAVETLNSEEKVFVSVPPVGVDSKSRIFAANKVVLAVDAFESLLLAREAAKHAMLLQQQQQDNIGSSSSCGSTELKLVRAQQIVRTLVAFRGTCRDLDAPHAVPVFWRKCMRVSVACKDPGIIEWKTVTLRDVPNEIVSCVVEGPVPPSLISNCSRGVHIDHATEYHQHVLGHIAKLFPKTAGKEVYVASLEPFSRGFSHNPARYAGGPGGLSPTVNGLDNVILAFDEFTMSNCAGSVLAAYLAAHAALGYAKNDLHQLHRDLLRAKPK